MASFLVYTFFRRQAVTSRSLYLATLSGWDKQYVTNRASLYTLVHNSIRYDFVVGIADHMRRAKESRFDPVYKNNYGKQIILPDAPQYSESNLHIALPPHVYRFTSTSNGPCNRSAFLIMNEIHKSNAKTTFGFFHLTHDYTPEKLTDFLDYLHCTALLELQKPLLSPQPSTISR